MFIDRKDGALQLAHLLMHLKEMDGVVVSIPRGGVVTGYYVAEILGWSLSYVLTKKIPHPMSEEFAIGAVGLHETYLEQMYDVPGDEMNHKIESIRRRLRSRLKGYSKVSPPEDLNGKWVIITDDGIATGHTVKLAIKEVKRENPEHVIVAVPVASPRSIQELEPMADEVICLHTPAYFRSVGQFYQEFPPVTDYEVMEWLKRSHEEPSENVRQPINH